MTSFGGPPGVGGFPINGRFSGPAPTSSSAIAPPMGQRFFVPPLDELRRLPAAAALQRCYKWLEQAVKVAPQMASLVPPLLTAVQLYEAGHYEASFAQANAVMQVIGQLRASIPALPPF